MQVDAERRVLVQQQPDHKVQVVPRDGREVPAALARKVERQALEREVAGVHSQLGIGLGVCPVEREPVAHERVVAELAEELRPRKRDGGDAQARLLVAPLAVNLFRRADLHPELALLVLHHQVADRAHPQRPQQVDVQRPVPVDHRVLSHTLSPRRRRTVLRLGRRRARRAPRRSLARRASERFVVLFRAVSRGRALRIAAQRTLTSAACDRVDERHK